MKLRNETRSCAMQGWQRFALGLAVACATAGVLWLVTGLRTESRLEVPRSQMALREGRWYLAGQTAPFTGVLVETYDSGKLKARSAISNGLPEGLSEGWYTNGQRQVQEHFHLGLSHGLRTKWYANGRKQSEVMILAGKLEGTFRRWNEDGTLSEEIELKQGSPDGVSRAYHPSGFLKTEVRLRNGQVLDRKTWSDGEHERPASTPNDSLPTGQRRP